MDAAPLAALLFVVAERIRAARAALEARVRKCLAQRGHARDQRDARIQPGRNRMIMMMHDGDDEAWRQLYTSDDLTQESNEIEIAELTVRMHAVQRDLTLARIGHARDRRRLHNVIRDQAEQIRQLQSRINAGASEAVDRLEAELEAAVQSILNTRQQQMCLGMKEEEEGHSTPAAPAPSSSSLGSSPGSSPGSSTTNSGVPAAVRVRVRVRRSGSQSQYELPNTV